MSSGRKKRNKMAGHEDKFSYILWADMTQSLKPSNVCQWTPYLSHDWSHANSRTEYGTQHVRKYLTK